MQNLRFLVRQKGLEPPTYWFVVAFLSYKFMPFYCILARLSLFSVFYFAFYCDTRRFILKRFTPNSPHGFLQYFPLSAKLQKCVSHHRWPRSDRGHPPAGADRRCASSLLWAETELARADHHRAAGRRLSFLASIIGGPDVAASLPQDGRK